MLKTDINCLIGHWPFRKIRKSSFDDLKEIHAANGISSGYVSSIDSIFYNDPFEGDEELHEIIKDSGYHHILTVNPELPGFTADIEKGLNLFDIKGVKIYPAYHGYRLDNMNLDRLCEALREYGLPLFLPLRMEDERLNYIARPETIPTEIISGFIKKYSSNRIVLLNVRFPELIELKDAINFSNNIFFDICGLKDPLFPVEKLLELFSIEKMLYGSLYPLYCMKSSAFIVDEAEISDSKKEKIFYGNSMLIMGK